jgi:flagellar protein FlaG
MSVASVGYTPVSPAPAPITVRPDAAETEPKKEKTPEVKEHHVISAAASDLERLVFNRKLQFVVDHNSHEVTVKVIDKDTDKVIKVLPPEELQRMHSDLRESIGFLFDELV